MTDAMNRIATIVKQCVHCWLAMLQAISDPYCQAVSVAVSICLSAAQLVPYRQHPRYAAKLAASQATSPTGLFCMKVMLMVYPGNWECLLYFFICYNLFMNCKATVAGQLLVFN